MEYQEITKVSKNVPEDNSENDKEIPKEQYISPEERQKTIDSLKPIMIV